MTKFLSIAIAAPPAAASSRRAPAVRAEFLVAAIVAGLGLDHLLLWRFIGFAPPWLFVAGAALLGAACWGAARLAARMAVPPIGIGRIAACVGIALVLYLLGGEGRLFYANPDWQVRDAILRDMTIQPWPFAYTVRGVPEMLRAPVGMYLVPAVAGKALGVAAGDTALLARNALLLGAMLALASLRFGDRRARLIALAAFLGFSGLDVIGRTIVAGAAAPLPDHLETWAQIQYSSHVTQAFWVPQHAIAGWLPALLFLLWKDRRLPVGVLLAAVPLVALWSPLGPIGALPFAGYAAIRTLRDRALTRADVGLAALATLIALPALAYLATAGGSVGVHLLAVPLGRWLLFQLVETAPYLAAVAAIGARGRGDRATLILVAATLAILPFVQIGESIDLMMRGSIPALALLAAMVADALAASSSGDRPGQRAWALALAILLAIGSVTGFSEIRRALLHRPVPRAECSFPKAWDQSFGTFGKSTYLAPVAAFPRPIRPRAPALLPTAEPQACWRRPWKVRVSGG